MFKTFGLTDHLVAEIAVVDQNGAIVHCNRKWNETAKIGRLSPALSRGNYLEECKAAVRRGCPDAVVVLEGLRAVLSGELPSFVANYSCPLNGMHRWFQVLISAFEAEGSRLAMLMHVDVSALQRDLLTGLANRAMFDAQLDLTLSLARDTGRRTGLILLDLNNLKLINDVYGHVVGDAALRLIATELKKEAAPECLVARIGGDEFGVVLPVSYDTLAARRLRVHFEAGIACKIGTKLCLKSISASVGIALYPDDATTSIDLYKLADKSMYRHKRGMSTA